MRATVTGGHSSEKKFHINSKLYTRIKSLRWGAAGSVPRRPMRAMWHDQEEGASWLAGEYELGAEQLQQSLTITVSGWGNGTAGRRGARMKLSSSWYHKIKLVMPEMTKQYAEPSQCSKTRFFFSYFYSSSFFFLLNNWNLQITDIMGSPVVTSDKAKEIKALIWKSDKSCLNILFLALLFISFFFSLFFSFFHNVISTCSTSTCVVWHLSQFWSNSRYDKH